MNELLIWIGIGSVIMFIIVDIIVSLNNSKREKDMARKPKEPTKEEIDYKVIKLFCDDAKKQAKGMDQKNLRHSVREIERLLAELHFYLDVRNEQGRGGEK